MRSFHQLMQFLLIPLAMTGFILAASQAGGFVLRTDHSVKIDSHLIAPGKPPPS